MTDENSTNNDPDRQDFLHGQLLVAMPNLRDGCFRESVVLICSHDEDHAMGLILNKTISDLTFSDLLLQVKLKPSDDIDDRPIHFGGPVDTKRGAVLQAIPSAGMVIVQGVNQRWKHLRRTQDNPQGGRVQREMPIPACKVRKVEE